MNRGPGRVAAILAGAVGPRLAGLMLKELRLLLREPQVRMSVALLLTLSMGLIALARNEPLLPQGLGTLYLVSGISVTLFAAVFTNSLAIEREGLRFLFTAPVSILEVLVSKNLAILSLILALQVPALVLGTWIFAAPFQVPTLLLESNLLLAVCLVGAGNLSSSIPYKWPARGLQATGGSGAARTMAAMVAAFLALCLGSLAAGLSAAWIAIPALFWGGWALSLGFAPALITSVTFWAVFTGLASRIIELRRERIFHEILD